MKPNILYSLRGILLFVLFLGLVGVACPLVNIGMPPKPTSPSGAAVSLPPTARSGSTLPTEETPQGPCTFTAAGAAISGWYWLRDVSYAAAGRWDCHGLPTGQDLPVTLQTLVTDQVDGGSGYSSPVQVTYTNPSSQTSSTIQVYLQNPLARQSPANSQGAGYPTTGYFVVPKEYLDDSGGLTVLLERFSPNLYHVAVNAQSLNFVQPRQADSFVPSQGTLISGWYWLRDTAYRASGQWSFSGLDPKAPATLVFDLLATNGLNGGSGYSTTLQVTLTNPADNTQKTFRHIVAQNLLFTQSAVNSGGAGYQAYGSLSLEPGTISAGGELVVQVGRLSGAAEHLAVNQNSVAVVQPGSAQVQPSPAATQVSGSGGGTGNKYLFLQYWNEVSGTGKLPSLAIDFPDYRFDPAAGTLSSFNPNQTISLAASAVGFIGQVTSRSAAAGTGAVSSLKEIDRLPFSLQVPMFTGSVNLQAAPNMEGTRPAGLVLLTVDKDGTIAILLDSQSLMLAPGKSWTHTVEADVKSGGYNGHLVMTSTLTNYGWQDRLKINLR